MSLRGEIHETCRIIDDTDCDALHIAPVPAHCIPPLLVLCSFLGLTPACKGTLIGYTPEPLIFPLLKKWLQGLQVGQIRCRAVGLQLFSDCLDLQYIPLLILPFLCICLQTLPGGQWYFKGQNIDNICDIVQTGDHELTNAWIRKPWSFLDIVIELTP